MLVNALNMIENEGILNRFLFDEKDLHKIKNEIIEILKLHAAANNRSSIWINYSGSSSLGGPTKASELFNIGLKDPVLHYIKKENIIAEVTNLAEPMPISKKLRSKSTRKLLK